MAAQGLDRCPWGFSSCGAGSSVSFPCLGFSCCTGSRCMGSAGAALRLQVTWVSVVVAHKLSCPEVCGVISFRTKNRTRVACLARQILNHWTTRKLPPLFFMLLNTFGQMRKSLQGIFQMLCVCVHTHVFWGYISFLLLL